MRCPFLFFMSHQDPFLDPFSKWPFHVFFKLRRLSFSEPDIVRKVLRAAKAEQRAPARTRNGIAHVVAYLCNELQWTIR